MKITRSLLGAAWLVAVAMVGTFGTSCKDSADAQLCSTGIYCESGTQCAAAQAVCIINNCGNGKIDPGEVCDDGNIKDGDGCSANCLSLEVCGNCILDPGEVCDDCNTVSGDGCSADCKSTEVCGNCIVDVGEVCDDCNTVGGDGCSADCKSTEVCGNCIVDTDVGEVCDTCALTGTPNPNCSPDCRSGLGCGNGVLDPGEECDDGNTSNNDDCLNDCKIATCGDGYVDSTGSDFHEQCDGANPGSDGSNGSAVETASCNLDCTISTCGDGKINKTAGEQCDGGATNSNSGDCTVGSAGSNIPGCQINVCGDGYADTTGTLHQEACDGATPGSGSAIPVQTATCTTTCATPTCGDGELDPLFVVSAGPPVLTEQCDPPNAAEGCSPQCQLLHCGNGVIDTGEACDDGSANSLAGPCLPWCQIAKCGDGILETGEACDPSVGTGSNVPSKCNTDCTVSSCGDGKLNKDAGEQCDSGAGNSNNGDCTAGSGTVPGCQLNVCGDGFADTTGSHHEDCDAATPSINLAAPVQTATCTIACKTPTCGDSELDPLFVVVAGPPVLKEQCDPPSTSEGCSLNCQLEHCGNGVIDPGETCDDGNTDNNDDCPNDCQLAKCGDGILDSDGTVHKEACDPSIGTGANTPALCNSDCTVSACGDGKINLFASPPEQCDTVGSDLANDDCTPKCQLAVCGDGYQDTVTGSTRKEACDPSVGTGANSAALCNSDCTVARCGDSKVDTSFVTVAANPPAVPVALTEQCDPPNSTDCDADCQLESCGNGVIDIGEQCDNGSNNSANGPCLTNCQKAVCGDGIVETHNFVGTDEKCDFGSANGSACAYGLKTCATCSADCGVLTSNAVGTYCGDGITEGAETCDPPNGVTCNDNCQAVSCSDSERDGNESDVDCGGSCATKCATGKQCGADKDCSTDSCSGGGICLAATCTDGVKNGSETAIDCGGTTCDALHDTCANGSACGVAADCTSSVCTGGLCQVSCTDGVLDNGETDLDCGGPNCDALDIKCANGSACDSSTDCTNDGACTGGICQAPTCSDGIKNEGESGVDCGGTSSCGLCTGSTCTSNGQCHSDSCGVATPGKCD